MDHDFRKFESDNGNKKRSNMFCYVPQCSKRLSFHTEDVALKTQWEVVLKMGKKASTTFPGTISQDYRQRLFPHAVPSHNLSQRPSASLNIKVKQERKERQPPVARQKVSATIIQDLSKMDNLSSVEVERRPPVSLSEPAKIVFSIK